jgi:hypothetical protein
MSDNSQITVRLNSLEELIKSLIVKIDNLPETVSSALATIIIAQVCPMIEEIVNKSGTKSVKTLKTPKLTDSDSKSVNLVNSGIHQKYKNITVKGWENEKQYIQQLYRSYPEKLQTLIPGDVYKLIEESDGYKVETEKPGSSRHKLSVYFNSCIQKLDKDKLKSIMDVVNLDRNAEKKIKDNNDFQRVSPEEKSENALDVEKD